MIQEVTMYQAVCEGCGAKCLAFNDTAVAKKYALQRREWTEIKGKLYCPDCVEFDEETGRYKLKAKDNESV